MNGSITKLTALEFFSGIGGFAEAARYLDTQVVAAYDQDSQANQVYFENFHFKPRSRNLDGIKKSEIPEADLWWLSPPCTPYTIRGQQKDAGDPRAASLLNLIGLIGQCRPRAILLENVQGFQGSVVYQKLSTQLKNSGYKVKECDLCPTAFGIPMKRPRHFVIACRESLRQLPGPTSSATSQHLSSFLVNNPGPELTLLPSVVTQYGPAFNVIDPTQANPVAICFTSGYWKCHKASGSLLKLNDQQVRRFSADEILALLGFSKDFHWPENLSHSRRLQLVGNSLDVRAVKLLLAWIKQCLDKL